MPSPSKSIGRTETEQGLGLAYGVRTGSSPSPAGKSWVKIAHQTQYPVPPTHLYFLIYFSLYPH